MNTLEAGFRGGENHSLPLNNLPSPEMRSTRIQKERIHVAGHELNHALTAHFLGVPVLSISVIPEGNTLGKTIVGGALNPAKTRAIFAAGSVETHDGTANGYGYDVSIVNRIDLYHPEHSHNSPQAEARTIINQVPKDIRERAAEIIAYMGVVPGSLLPDILKRAHLELEHEGRNVPPFEIDKNEQIEVFDKDTFSIISELKNGSKRVQIIKNFKKISEHMYCNLCDTINAHSPDCPSNQ